MRRTGHRRGLLATFAALSVLAVLTAAGCASQATEQAASESAVPEGALVVYSGRSEELVGDLMDDFTEATGIPVSVRYGDTAELAAQLLEEGDRSPAAVFFSQDAGALQALENAGLLTALPQQALSKVEQRYRSEAGKWVGTSGRARVLLYNKELVKPDELPDSVFELTQPRWKGQVGIAPTNASFQSFVTAMRITEGDEATRKWLQDLVANDVQKFENNVAIRDAVDAGQIQLGLANHYYWYEKANEVGAENLKVANHFLKAGDPGSLVNVAGAGVLDAANPDARRFVEFLLSKRAQEYFSTVTAEYPLVAGVAPQKGLPALDSIKGPDLTLGQLADVAATQQLLQETGLL